MSTNEQLVVKLVTEMVKLLPKVFEPKFLAEMSSVQKDISSNEYLQIMKLSEDIDKLVQKKFDDDVSDIPNNTKKRIVLIVDLAFRLLHGRIKFNEDAGTKPAEHSKEKCSTCAGKDICNNPMNKSVNDVNSQTAQEIISEMKIN